MLTHPTLEQLHALGLHGIAKGFKELEANPEARARNTPSGSPSCSNTGPRCDARSASRRAHAPRAFVNQQASIMSTIVHFSMPGASAVHHIKTGGFENARNRSASNPTLPMRVGTSGRYPRYWITLSARANNLSRR
jgi:hypothetical protein